MSRLSARQTNARDGPRRAYGPSGLGLTLGYDRGCDRVFADGAFTNRIFANRRGLGNWLRTWKVRSNRCSHESQRHSADDHEFQHRSPLAAKVSPELTGRLFKAQQIGSRADVFAILFPRMLQKWHLVWARGSSCRGRGRRRQACRRPQAPTRPILLDDRRDTPLTVGDSHSR